MVAEFCVWRPVNTKSAARGSGRSSHDWGRLGGPIDPVPGSYLQFFGLRHPSIGIEGDQEIVGHRVGGEDHGGDYHCNPAWHDNWPLII